MRKFLLLATILVTKVAMSQSPLPRSAPETEHVKPAGITAYMEAVKASGEDLHSFMVLRRGHVVAEHWYGDNAPEKNHILNSVSKTFTATAIGFMVAEHRIHVTDRVTMFFKDILPDSVSPNLAALTIRDLLTMSVGHDSDLTTTIRNKGGSWEKSFLAAPIEYKPGTHFVYNSLASYMLSAIVQRVTHQKVVDYLTPRLFNPLGITGQTWETSPTGINCGGWGLYLKTEDLAKMGQFFLQQGNWNGKQVLPAAWFREATTPYITQPAVWVKPGTDPATSDYLQGYCYQMWRCRHNAYRADGANGQLIIMIPDKDAVVVTTANHRDIQSMLNLIWDNLLPAMQ